MFLVFWMEQNFPNKNKWDKLKDSEFFDYDLYADSDFAIYFEVRFDLVVITSGHHERFHRINRSIKLINPIGSQYISWSDKIMKKC